MPLKEGTTYYQVYLMNGEPTGLYFRVTVSPAGMSSQRFDWAAEKWIDDGEMLDYWWGFEPGAEDVTPEEVQAAGIPIEGEARS